MISVEGTVNGCAAFSKLQIEVSSMLVCSARASEGDYSS